MKLNRRTALAGAAALPFAPVARAEDFPTKPIKIVVPFAAGSATDLVARGLGARLQEILKQMADRILFDFDKAELDAADRAVLAEVAALLATTPEIELLSVEGHASSEGSDAYNDDLSRRRAQAAIDGLIAAGVAPARLKSAHFGEAKPFVANTTEDRRRQNRRVEFHIERFKGPTQ